MVGSFRKKCAATAASHLCLVLCLGSLGAIAGCAGGPTRDQVQRSQREYDLGLGLWQENNRAGSFEHLLTAIELDPLNAEAHLMLGHLFFLTRHDYQRSEHHYREAIRANQQVPARAGLDADARNSMGVMFMHAGRVDEATEVFRESASDLMNREPAIAWSNLGWAYYELESYDRALEVLNQSVALQPQLCMAWYWMGEVRTARGELTEAEEALSRGLEVDDETCQQLQAAWRLRGEVRARRGHLDAAVGDLERCVEISDRNRDGRTCSRLLARGTIADERG